MKISGWIGAALTGLALTCIPPGGGVTAETLRVVQQGNESTLDVPMNRAVVVESDVPFAELSIAQSGDDTTISVEGAVVAVLLDIEVSALTARDFLF